MKCTKLNTFADGERICNISELRCVGQFKKEILALSASALTRLRVSDNKGLPKNIRDCGCLSSCEIDIYLKDEESLIPQPQMNRLKIAISSFPKHRIVRNLIFSFEDIICKYIFISFIGLTAKKFTYSSNRYHKKKQ